VSHNEKATTITTTSSFWSTQLAIFSQSTQRSLVSRRSKIFTSQMLFYATPVN